MNSSNFLLNAAGIFGVLTYVLFFLLLISANIALWVYIIKVRRFSIKDWKDWPHEGHDEGKDKKERSK